MGRIIQKPDKENTILTKNRKIMLDFLQRVFQEVNSRANSEPEGESKTKKPADAVLPGMLKLDGATS